jgi:hypothetical protein
MVHEGVVVFLRYVSAMLSCIRQAAYDSKLLKQLNSLRTRAPRRRRPTPRLLPRDLRKHINALSQHVALLLFAQRGYEFVCVPMEADLVARVDDLADLLGERFGGVGGSEPCCFDVVFVPELQQAVDAYCCAENAAGDVGGIGWGAGFGVEPGGRLGLWS